MNNIKIIRLVKTSKKSQSLRILFSLWFQNISSELLEKTDSEDKKVEDVLRSGSTFFLNFPLFSSRLINQVDVQMENLRRHKFSIFSFSFLLIFFSYARWAIYSQRTWIYKNSRPSKHEKDRRRMENYLRAKWNWSIT